MGRIGIKSGLVRVAAEAPLMALSFPSNVSGSDTAAPYAVIQYANPHSNGLPIWGPGGVGVTVFRRCRVRQQTGYSAGFWYADAGTSFAVTASGGYWGFHPYPISGNNAGTTSKWEISTDTNDFTFSEGGGAINCVYDTWHTQALRVVRTNANLKTFTFYTNLPSVEPEDVIEGDVATSNYGEANPPYDDPMLTIGDSPWFANFQHERFSGDIAEQLIVAKAMPQAQIVAQADLQSLTAASIADLWWWKKNYSSVDDLTCDGGTGRSFVRNDDEDLITLVSAA